MTNRTALVKSFLASLRPSGDGKIKPRADLLTEDATFEALLKLSPELKALVNSALLTRHPMLMSYVNESGQPVLSFRGSTQTFSDDQLAIWIRNADGSLLRSVAKNSKVAFMYRNEDTKETFQF